MSDLVVTQTMSIKEFREFGYLQEVNRQFFHPLGLALCVGVSLEGDEDHLGWILRTDDPEGMIYAPGEIDLDKAERVVNEQMRRGLTRSEALGYVIQSVRRKDA